MAGAETMQPPMPGSTWLAVTEVVVATTAVLAAYKALKLVEPPGWNVAPGATMLAAVSLLAISPQRRRAVATSARVTARAFDVGLVLVVPLSAIALAVMAGHSLGWGLEAQLVRGVLTFVTLPLLWWLARRANAVPMRPRARVLLLSAAIAAVGAGIWGSGLGAAPVAQLAVSRIVFTALGEELFFRGYVQTRLNERCGRRWHVAGANWGPGLLVASALFGAVHAANPAQPWLGDWQLAWTWGAVTFASGLVFGALRELTGGIWAGVVVHAVTGVLGGLLAAVPSA